MRRMLARLRPAVFGNGIGSFLPCRRWGKARLATKPQRAQRLDWRSMLRHYIKRSQHRLKSVPPKLSDLLVGFGGGVCFWGLRAVGDALGGPELDFSFLVRDFAVGVFGHDDQRLRAVGGVEGALKGLRLHAALLARILFESGLKHFRLAVELVRYCCRQHGDEHRHRSFDLYADNLAITVRSVAAIDLEK